MSSEWKTYRKKPVEIQAKQWTGENAHEMSARMGSASFTQLHGSMRDGSPYTAQIWVQANEEWLRIQTGEWVIQDSKGFYPCKPDIFAATYNEASAAVHALTIESGLSGCRGSCLTGWRKPDGAP